MLARSLNCGGAERQLVMLAKGLKNKGYEVIVAVFYSGGHFEQELEQSGVTVSDLRKTGRWAIVSFLSRLSNLLKCSQPSVVYGFLSLPNILTVLMRKIVPRAKIVWGMRATDPQFGYYNWLVPLVYRIENLLSRYSDLIIVNSDAGRKDCEQRNFPKSKLLVIKNGIDTGYFSPNADAGQAFRNTIDVREKEKLIGIVGRLDPMKNHVAFLDTFALVAKHVSGVKALILGEKSKFHEDYLDNLHKQAAQLGIAHLLIWKEPLDNMPAVYSGLDLLVSASSFGEGFPNVVAEAMSCTTPCVVTYVGDSSDIVGKFGAVVESGDPSTLANAIIRLIANKPTESIRRQMRQHIKDNFSVEKYIEATEQAICSRG